MRVIVGVGPSSDSDPPLSGTDSDPPSIEARGGSDPPSVGGVDPLDALETLERPAIDPTQTLIDGTPTHAHVHEATDAQPEPKSFPTDDVAADSPNSEKARFGATLAFGSSLNDEMLDARALELPAPKSTRAEPATQIAEAPPAPPSRSTQEIVQPVKVDEAPLPSPKRVTAAPAEASGGKKNKNGKNSKNKKNADDVASSAGPESVSVPPGDVDEAFFSEADVSRHLAKEEAIEGDALTISDTAKRKSEPYVIERRARFVRYVKWAVAGAAVVCVAALLRTTLSSKPAPPSTLRNAAVVTEVQPVAEPKAATPVAAPLPEALAAAPAAAAAPSESASASPEPAAPTAAASAEPAAAAPTPTDGKPEAKPDEPVTGDAREEKAKARSALEKRKIADAIEAGERSVKLDPTDGEAWLLLGASYQEKGNMTEARRAYSSCVKEATTGPRQECAKMLR